MAGRFARSHFRHVFLSECARHEHYVNKGFTAMQLNLDGYMFCNIWLTASFIYVVSTEGFIYSVKDIIFATSASWLSLASTVCLTKALQTGKGGPIQAIDSLKSLVQLTLVIIVYRQWSTLMQNFGIASSIAGAMIISYFRAERKS